MAGRMIYSESGLHFGIGLDGLTEEFRAESIDFDGITTDAGGQIVESSCKMIESQESLCEAMNVSVGLSARYGMISGEARFKMATQTAVNKYSVYWLFNVSIRNPAQRMINPRLKPEAAKICSTDMAKFKKLYGDYFINEIYTGGSFFGLFVFETEDANSSKDIAASLKLSAGTLFAGGDLNASFETSIKEASHKANLEIYSAISGGSGLVNSTNFETLKEIFSNFNKAVESHPITFKASIKDFTLLPLPEGATLAENLVQSDVITQCGQRVLKGIRLRGDIDFILAHPNQFEAFDAESLRKVHDQIDTTLPTLAKRARACSLEVGDCSLAGIEDIEAQLPIRLASTIDPIEQKFNEVCADTLHAAPYFENGNRPSLANSTPSQDGRGNYVIFNVLGNPSAGIFWSRDVGAHAVYGDIFNEYRKQDLCNGPLGFPTTDETTIVGFGADGTQREVKFQRGVLWTDKDENGAVQMHDAPFGSTSHVAAMHETLAKVMEHGPNARLPKFPK